MTTQRKITRPGMYDNEYLTVTCTPDKTSVEFFEFQEEAEDAARTNLHPTTTSYVAKVIKQGEHAIRGTASHIALLVEVDDELRRALARNAGMKGRPKRAHVAGMLGTIMADAIDRIREEYRAAFNDEVTHPGDRPEVPPSISCHAGRRCTNWPQCESCGPARL